VHDADRILDHPDELPVDEDANDHHVRHRLEDDHSQAAGEVERNLPGAGEEIEVVKGHPDPIDAAIREVSWI
jgi:hypothetical protein